jgi:hypothetical protein
VFEIVDYTDTTLQIIGFTITASSGGESNDEYGAVISVRGNYDWDTGVTNYTGATFRDCIIKDVISDEVLIQTESSNFVLQNCEFRNDTIIYNSNNPSNNPLFGNGGVIRIGKSFSDYGASNVWIKQSRFVNNLLTTTSGPVYISGGAIFVCDNPDNYVYISNTIIANNENYNSSDQSGYINRGGAVYISGGEFLLNNSTLVNNTLRTDFAPSESGSAIYCQDSQSEGEEIKLTIFNSIVHGNTYITNASTNPVISNLEQFYFNNENDGVDVYASYSLFGGDDDS